MPTALSYYLRHITTGREMPSTVKNALEQWKTTIEERSGATFEKIGDELANAESPDPELDLRGLLAPLWGHHSNRRGADTQARNNMHITGVTERDIDLQFGWNEHVMQAIMQLHYESNVERDRRSKVTSMM